MTPETRPKAYPELIFFKPLYLILIFTMALTGFGQMPVFKRYYIADIPGFSWLANYYATHYIHYIGAIALFVFFVYAGVVYFGMIHRQFKLTWAAYIRIALLALIVVTGIFRVLKNLPDVVFSPLFTMMIDISHLTFMLFLLLSGILFIILRKGWLVQKDTI
jgi:hypothetical protein